MAKFLTETSLVHNGDNGKVAASNYIQQINVGGTTYDIATHHSITFIDGQGGERTAWNGITDLEVVIPKISDLVTNPIRLVGTVDGTGITYTDGRTEKKPVIGDLVYMAADCTFNGTPCEAGDMAVYAGDPKGWVIVSGENQVTINGIGEDGTATFSISSKAQSVLTVEGKTLSLQLDYADIYNNFSVEKNGEQNLETTGNVTVNGVYVGLSKADDKTLDISTEVSFNNATAVSSDAVTINEKVLTASDFSWNAGALPTLKKDSVTVNISDNRTITKTDSSDGIFVTNIDASVVKSAVLNTDAGLADGTSYIASASTTSGTQVFVSGVHTKTSDDKGRTADFTVMTYTADSSTNTFVSGLSAASTSGGDLLASVAVGKVSLVDGSGILTGITDASDGAIVTGVNFGSVVSNESNKWFVSGLEKGGTDVVTNVTAISAATLVEDANTSLKKSAVVSASVSGHVLSLGFGDVMKPVSVSTSAAVVTKGGFVKGGVSLTGQSVSKANFTQSALKQADSTFTYKNVLTGNVTMTSTPVEYFFDKKNETIPTYTTSKMKLDVSFANVTKANPHITGTLTANIPSNTVVTAFASAGQLPSLSVKDATGTLTGKLASTALSSTPVSFLAIDASKEKATNLAGAYSLVSASTSTSDYIKVAQASTYQLAEGIAEVPAYTFVKDVYVSSVAVNKRVK